MSKKFFIFLTIFIDALGIGIIIPVMPFYVEMFGLSATHLTWLMAVFAVCSFFSAPILGVMSDRYGRKPILALSLLSTAIGWLVFVLANNPLWLFIGRIIDGLAAGNISTAQSYLVDVSSGEKDRMKNLGFSGALFGIAFVIGPAFGGLLSSIKLTLPFWAIGVLALINTFLVLFFLPESKKPNPQVKFDIHPFKPILRAIKNLQLRQLLFAWFFFGLAMAIQQSIFALYLDKAFNFNSAAIGWTMMAIGLFMSINQGILIGRFWLKKFTLNQLSLMSSVLCFFGMILFSMINWFGLIVGLVVSSIGLSLYRVSANVGIMEVAGESNRGEIAGVAASVFSLSMIASPLFSGVLFDQHMSWPYLVAAFFMLIAFFLSLKKDKVEL